MRFKVIVNPIAGNGKALNKLPEITAILKLALIDYELVLTEWAGHATELAYQAVEERFACVVAVGGDGTINEVINGLAGTGIPLAVIPVGTGNDLVRSLKLPRTMEGAVQTLLKHRIVEMDLGSDQRHKFASVAGIGFPADVMCNLSKSKGIFRGPVAYVWGILKTLAELRPIPITLQLDGKDIEVKAQGVFIMNTAYAGGGLRFSPQADFTDGMLDVLVMRDMSRLDIMSVLPRVYRGTHLNHPKVDFYRAREIKIAGDVPTYRMLDGNVFTGEGPMTLRVYPKALKVLVP